MEGLSATSPVAVAADYFVSDVDGDEIADVIVPQKYTASTYTEKNTGYKIYKGNTKEALFSPAIFRGRNTDAI